MALWQVLEPSTVLRKKLPIQWVRVMKSVSDSWLYFLNIICTGDHSSDFIFLVVVDSVAILLIDVFGIAGYHTWPFPIDPVFEDWDRVMGYSTPQRLSREQNFMERQGPGSNNVNESGSIELPKRGNEYLPVWSKKCHWNCIKGFSFYFLFPRKQCMLFVTNLTRNDFDYVIL